MLRMAWILTYTNLSRSQRFIVEALCTQLGAIPFLSNHINAIIFTFLGFLHRFSDVKYFSVIWGVFLTFSKEFEIQDGGSKMEVALTSLVM